MIVACLSFWKIYRFLTEGGSKKVGVTFTFWLPYEKVKGLRIFACLLFLFLCSALMLKMFSSRIVCGKACGGFIGWSLILYCSKFPLGKRAINLDCFSFYKYRCVNHDAMPPGSSVKNQSPSELLWPANGKYQTVGGFQTYVIDINSIIGIARAQNSWITPGGISSRLSNLFLPRIILQVLW